MSPNDADGMANSADPDQTAPTVCLGKSVRKLRIITVSLNGAERDRNVLICLNSDFTAQSTIF